MTTVGTVCATRLRRARDEIGAMRTTPSMLRSIIASVTRASLASSSQLQAMSSWYSVSVRWSVMPSRMSVKNGLRMSGSITPMV